MRHFGLSLNEAFWGLWLLPLGMLVIKSRFFPRFLGAWLIAGGVAWVGISFVNIVLPDYSKLAFNAAQPFTLAEVAAMIWLIKGPSVGSSVASSAAVP